MSQHSNSSFSNVSSKAEESKRAESISSSQSNTIISEQRTQKLLMDKLQRVFEAVSKLMELDSCSLFLKSVFTSIALSHEPNPLSQEGKAAFKEAAMDLVSVLMQD